MPSTHGFQSIPSAAPIGSLQSGRLYRQARSFTVRSAPEGGFVVFNTDSLPGEMHEMVRATSTIEEALEFVRQQFPDVAGPNSPANKA